VSSKIAADRSDRLRTFSAPRDCMSQDFRNRMWASTPREPSRSFLYFPLIVVSFLWYVVVAFVFVRIVRPLAVAQKA
jgi:hypothetical protein